VRALYDFEAAEDNELTFKAGEIICILDDSDVNWWKGTSSLGEGLFPANFVTADLSVEPEESKKSVKFNEEVEVKTVEPIPDVIEIDEEKIEKLLTMLQNADPTGAAKPDPPELPMYEEICKAMNPLIDTELEKVDRKHASLMELNGKVIDALQLYHNLMKELPGYGYTTQPKIGQPLPPMAPGQQQMFSGPYMMPPGVMPGQGMGPPPPGPGQGAPPNMAGQQQQQQQQQQGPPQGMGLPPNMPPTTGHYTVPSTMANSSGAPPPGVNYAPPTSANYIAPAPHEQLPQNNMQNNFMNQPMAGHQPVYVQGPPPPGLQSLHQQPQQQPLL
jgi:signal transducing adaptor molecule